MASPAAADVAAPNPTAPRRRRRPDAVVAGAVVVGFVLRLAWSAYAARTPASFGDPLSYLWLAEDVASGKGYVTFYLGTPTAYYPPGYPMILAALLSAARVVAPGTTPMQVAIGLNVVCGTATIAFVASLTGRLSTRRAARIAAVLMAVFPNLILYTATAYLETVFCFLVAVIAWILVGPPARRLSAVDHAPTDGRPALAIPSVGWLLLLAATFSVATMVRPITLAFLPVLFVAWGVGRPGWWKALGGVAVVGVAVLVLAVPWSIGSSRALHGTVLISTNSGDNFCVGHSPESFGGYLDVNDQCGQGLDDVPEDEREVVRNRRGMDEAVAYARANPGREVWLLARKTWYLLSHDHEGVDAVEAYGQEPFLPDALRTALKVVADAFYYLVGAIALVGAAWVAWRGDGRSRLVLAWAATLLLVPLIFFGTPRFHLPALPFVAVFAALAIDGWLRRRSVPAADASA